MLARLLMFVGGGILAVGGLFLMFAAIVTIPFVAQYTDSMWVLVLGGFVMFLIGIFLTRMAVSSYG